MDLHTAQNTALEWLWQTTWQAAVLAGLILLAQWLLRKRLAPRWRCMMWGLLLLRLAMPVLPESRLSLFNLPRPSVQSVRVVLPDKYVFVRAEPLEAAQTNTRAPDPVIQAASPVTWQTGVLIAWLLGTLLVVARLIGATILFARKLRRMPQVRDESLLHDFDACCRELDVRHPPRIVESDCIPVPALYGILCPVLLLPAGLMHRLSTQERRFVLCHELVHLKRKDVLAGVVMWLFNAIHWFNPVLWYAAARFRADREMACDARVLALAADGDGREYGQTILKLVETITQPVHIPLAAAIVRNSHSLGQRISLIARPIRSRRLGSLIAILLILAIGVMTLTGSSRGQATQPAPLVTRVYDIRDLLVNVTDFALPPATELDEDGWPTRKQHFFGVAPSTQTTRQQFVDALVEQIQLEIAPASWAKAGAQGPNITEVRGQFIIRQTPEVHDNIVAALTQWRDAKSLQVTVETRFITGNLGLDESKWVDAPGHRRWPVMLEDDEVRLLLRIVQRAQETTILTAPRLTLFDGQRTFVVVATDTDYIAAFTTRPTERGVVEFDPVIKTLGSGVLLDVRAKVTADRKSVDLELRASLRRVLGMEEIPLVVDGQRKGVVQKPTRSVVKLDTVANVPQGKTLLLKLDPQVLPKATPAAPPEPPIYLLVHPTIIMHREVEQAPFPILGTQPNAR